MNLFDLAIPAIPGTQSQVPAISAASENPQETALFGGFEELFAITIAPQRQVATADGAQLPELPDGKDLPVENGKHLPELAAVLPDVALPDVVLPDVVLPAVALPEAIILAPAQLAAQPGELAETPESPSAVTTIPASLPQARLVRAHAPTPEAPASLAEVPTASAKTTAMSLAPVPAVAKGDVAAAVAAEPNTPAAPTPAPGPVQQPQPMPTVTSPRLEAALEAALPREPASALRIAMPPAAEMETGKPLATPLVSIALRPLKLATATIAPVLAEPGAPAPTEHAAKPATTERVASLVPVAQLLRPVAAKATAQPAAPVTAEAAEEIQPQRAAPVAAQPAQPAPQQVTPQQSAPAAPMVVEAPRAVSSTAGTEPAPAAQRHDFGQVVERLAEAREMARPGRAAMQVTHREFGHVSMQFDITGNALKVALANAHAGFAPAVQAALAERPLAAPAEMVRNEMAQAQSQTQTQAQTQTQSQTQAHASNPSTPASQQAAGQSQAPAAGQASGPSHGDAQQQRQQDTPHTAGVQSQPREQGESPESDSPLRTSRGRDNALFA